jgi:hypothetical protein
VSALDAGADAECGRPTITSGGSLNVTWTFLDEVKLAANNAFGVFVFYGLTTASPGADTVTIDFGAQTMNWCQWHIAEYDGTKLTGTNGADAWVQSVDNSGNGTQASATLAAFDDSTNNAPFTYTGVTLATDVTVESGYTTTFATVSTIRQGGGYKVGEDTSPTVDFAHTRDWGIVTGELALATANVTVEPGAASVTVTGQTPTITAEANVTVTPAAGSVTVAGQAPTVALGPLTVTPAAASITVTGQAPVADAPQTVALTTFNTESSTAVGAGVNFTIQPGAASIQLNAYAPTLDTYLTPGAASVTVTGQTPTVSVTADKTPQPGTSSITIAGQVPSIDATNPQTVTPGAGAVTVTGHAPTIQSVGNKWIQPPASVVTYTGQAPVIDTSTTYIRYPAPATITVSGRAPTIGLPQSPAPAAASIVVTGQAPVADAPQSAAPAAASITLAPWAPLVLVGTAEVIAPAAATIVITGQAPTLGWTYTAAVSGAAAITLVSYAPIVYASGGLTSVAAGTINAPIPDPLKESGDE